MQDTSYNTANRYLSQQTVIENKLTPDRAKIKIKGNSTATRKTI